MFKIKRQKILSKFCYEKQYLIKKIVSIILNTKENYK